MNTADAMFDLWEVHPMTMKYFRETTDKVYYKRRAEERNFTQYVLYDGYMGFTTKASADTNVVPYHIEAKYWKAHTEIENSDASWESKQRQYYRAYRDYVREVEWYRDHEENDFVIDIAEYKPSKDGSEILTTVNTIKMPIRPSYKPKTSYTNCWKVRLAKSARSSFITATGMKLAEAYSHLAQ